MTTAIPKFNLTRIRTVRQRIYSRVFVGRLNEIMHGQMLLAAVRDLQRAIPAANRDAVAETLRVYVGEVLTEELCVQLCWRIAGNIDKLKRGLPVRPWAGQAVSEWMPLQLTRIRAVRRFGDVTNECTFKVLAGSACPMQLTRFMSRGALKYIASKVGFSRLSGAYPYRHVEDLTGLRLLGQFTAADIRDNQPSFREIACPTSMAKWNRDHYISVRTRKLPCPSKFNHTCAKCAYGTDRCAYAVHPVTYMLGHCLECSNQSAVFDPSDAGSLCVECAAKHRLRVDGVR